ncbi:Crp/Fnr family transcriptional regulator [Litoribacter ruber]|uniref:Crp/Fnr family transcriptional regulator n=1 Tax=Litoribacter ruber TaxID=702568 RepID=A0AAP2CGD2_9BACT|nr:MULTISPECIES: Crp/Fnr family transcriptional regulator [Litoribacter]MBS9523300.1 Crp/Fnr family transcriptional regulator [Litoribacter alkaliphilus]MBT0810536.1 Crp/Fnr family transcriptional regulator [Litoribacter ruber]
MSFKKAPKISCEDCKSRGRSLFGVLCSHEVAQISDAKSCTNYKKGQVLFHEGTRPLGVFCINNGKVKVYRLGADGKEQIMKITKEGDVLGYKAMIGEETYPVTAETLEDCTICFVPKNDFLSLLTDNPNFNKKLLQAVCQEIGVMSEKLTNLAQKSVRERLAITLLMLKDTYGIDGDKEPVEINLTREDLANIVGTATETLIRLLHDFKEENYISTKGRKIKVEDVKGLVRAAGLY